MRVRALLLGEISPEVLLLVHAQNSIRASLCGGTLRTVVITSGAGGTGVYSVQLARALGAARVVTAASANHFALLQQLGAHVVLDYHERSLWDVRELCSPPRVDVVIDNFGADGSAQQAMHCMRPNGTFVSLLLPKEQALDAPPGVKQVNLHFSSASATMQELELLLNAGLVTPVIEQRYPMSKISSAIEKSLAGHVTGKLAVLM